MLARAPVRPGRWAPTRGIPLHHPHAGRTGVLCFRVTRRGAQHMGLSLQDPASGSLGYCAWGTGKEW